MSHFRWLPLVVTAFLAASGPASAETYWLGRRQGLAPSYVFDVAVPADLAGVLACTDNRYAPYKGGVKEFQWDVGDKTYTFLQNDLSWDKQGTLDRGSIAFRRNGGVTLESWAAVLTQSDAWKACRGALLAQSKQETDGGWSNVTSIVLRSEGADNPNLVVNFNEDVPFNVAMRPARKDPQIVAVAKKDTLFVAYQTWDKEKPTGKVKIVKLVHDDRQVIPTFTAVREVSSGGQLVGFTVDDDGKDYTLTAKAEAFSNYPEGDFREAIDQTWRKGVLTLYSGGVATDLNSDKYTDKTFYGLCNSGSGRLVAGGNQLAAVFSRRSYSDGLIHQEANDLLMAADLSKVAFKAGNEASHSFDQRLIYDGHDFITLHQVEPYPFTGLIIEKLRTNPGNKPVAAKFLAFSCPTSGNDVFFELGGVAAEKDGYPVLFSATHNTEAVNSENASAKGEIPWDLGMAYVVRDFDAKTAPANPYDIVGSGILAKDYGKLEEFSFDNLTWDPVAKSYTKKVPRTINRRVEWLTSYSDDKAARKRATAPKLVQVGEGTYVVLYEEETLTNQKWKYEQTWGMIVTIEGNGDSKQIKKVQQRSFNKQRLQGGDEPVVLTFDGKPTVAWVTAWTNKKLMMNTIADNLIAQTIIRLP